MKTEIIELDNIYKFEKGNSTLLCGQNAFALNSLFYTMINNLCNKGGSVLLIESIFDKSLSIINQVSQAINLENDLKPEEFDLTIITFPKLKTSIKKFLSIINLKEWSHIFIKLPAKHFDSNLFSFINKSCSDFNISITSFPQYKKKLSSNFYQNLVHKNAYTIKIDNQTRANMFLAQVAFPDFTQEPIISYKTIELQCKDNVAIL